MLQYLPELDLRHLARPNKPDRRRTRSTGYLNDVTAVEPGHGHLDRQVRHRRRPLRTCQPQSRYPLRGGEPVHIGIVFWHPRGSPGPASWQVSARGPPLCINRTGDNVRSQHPLEMWPVNKQRCRPWWPIRALPQGGWSRWHLVREGNHLSRRERVGSTRQLDGVMSGDVDRSVRSCVRHGQVSDGGPASCFWRSSSVPRCWRASPLPSRG